jgi:uncharacterized protein (TIGR02145 family)
MKKSAILTALFLFSLSTLFGQVPQKINYQAVARHADGTAITNQQIAIRIAILLGSAQGNAVYTETHSVTTDDFGLFTLQIGGGSSPDSFDSVPWGDSSGLWIRVEMDPSGGGNYTLMGSSRIVSVPYALYAGKATVAAPVMIALSDGDRDAMVSPAEGTMIFNTTTHSLNVFAGGSWWEAGLTAIATTWQCGQPFTDSRNNKSYPTVSIGNKCWFAGNLDYGTRIDHTVTQADNGVVEKYCYNNDPANCETYGALYQWDEAMAYSSTPGSQGICPEGWHIPTDLEWQEMEISLGMTPSQAALSNTWRGTDQGTQLGPGGSAGYNALYSGRSVPGFGYTALGDYEYIWTSNPSGLNAWRRCLNQTDTRVGRYDTFPKTYGMSIRCIR